jgi:hypothetical protein
LVALADALNDAIDGDAVSQKLIGVERHLVLLVDEIEK